MSTTAIDPTSAEFLAAALLAAYDREIEAHEDALAELRARRDAVASALGAPAPTPVRLPALPTSPAPSLPNATTPKRTAAQQRATQRAGCPKCGREFSLSGLGRHKVACKGSGATTPQSVAAPAAPAAAPAPPVSDQTFACTECDYESATTREMATHTINRHKRSPLVEERTPLKVAP